MESTKILLIALVAAAVVGTGVYTTMLYTRSTESAYSPEVIKAYKEW
jgi:flagellar basal body-associated protein FliL